MSRSEALSSGETGRIGMRMGRLLPSRVQVALRVPWFKKRLNQVFTVFSGDGSLMDIPLHEYYMEKDES
ncbi:MAG: hypothetical protein CVU64_06685 [Deltaproteobacteria bacterium HGW-Deltaproteobacteria-21]|nr:MAG: hypothetical protein CVU64_06685 [Deltaproteobacteria bacterium HGW-Deltaproteobacteria-21]